jgi:hypothetical protein
MTLSFGMGQDSSFGLIGILSKAASVGGLFHPRTPLHSSPSSCSAIILGMPPTSDKQPGFHEPKKRPQRLRGTGAGTVKGRCHVSDRHGIIIRKYCHLFPMQQQTAQRGANCANRNVARSVQWVSYRGIALSGLMPTPPSIIQLAALCVSRCPVLKWRVTHFGSALSRQLKRA